MDITPALDPQDFQDAFLLDWTDHPQQGVLTNLPQAVGRALAQFRFNEASVEIDIAGPPLVISRCSQLLFNGNFATRDSVLLGDNLAGRLPVHLHFPIPLRSVGAAVSATGPAGRDYLAQCSLQLDDGQWHSVQPRLATLNRKRGTAPFLGGTAASGRSIVAVWFDVVDPRNRSDFPQVAINDLHFLPA